MNFGLFFFGLFGLILPVLGAVLVLRAKDG